MLVFLLVLVLFISTDLKGNSIYIIQSGSNLDLEIDMINNMLIIAKPKNLEDENYVKKIKAVADALDIDFLEFDDLEVDYLEEEENLYVTG